MHLAHWSIAQTKNRETEPEGLGWELFKNYKIALEKFKPDYFLYENNKSMAPAIRAQITRELGVEPIEINSALVSAQTRKRLYWTNIPGVQQPEDRGILLRDILESGIVWKEKAYCLAANRGGHSLAHDIEKSKYDYAAEPVNMTADGKAQRLRATYYKDGIRNMVGNTVDRKTCVAEPVRVGDMPNGGGVDGPLYAVPAGMAWRGRGDSSSYEMRDDQKANAVTADGHQSRLVIEAADGKTYPVYEVRDGHITIKGKQYPIKLGDGFYIIRKLTVTECSRLQTVPEWYFTPHIFRVNEVFLTCKDALSRVVKIPLRAEKQGSVISITCDFKGMEVLSCNDPLLTKAKNVSWMAVIDVSKQTLDTVLCTISDLNGSERSGSLAKKASTLRATTNTDSSIEELRQKCLEDSLNQEKSSIISTLIQQITTHLTSMCVMQGNTRVSIGCSEEKFVDIFPNSLTLDISYSTEKSMKLVSDSACYKMLGNGWTVDVIAHILSYCPGITEETLEVLSMYDGMSCGHLALDKLGAHIAHYYATEIDKYAIQTTQHNFPDVIQLGDAFQVREDGWNLPGLAEEETDTAPPPRKRYSIIYADPPWSYQKTGGIKSSRGMAKQHYQTMPLKEICALPVGETAAENCALFLWSTFPQIKQALAAIEAWGFEYFGAAFVWVKRNEKTGKDAFGMGYWTRANPEVCLLAFRGKMNPLRHDIRQLVYAPAGRHSEKPPEIRDKIVSLCGDLPRVELFARERAEGWDAWGNELPDSQDGVLEG